MRADVGVATCDYGRLPRRSYSWQSGYFVYYSHLVSKYIVIISLYININTYFFTIITTATAKFLKISEVVL